MTDDLIERLRNFEGSDALGNGDFSLLHEAAAALEAAREDAYKVIFRIEQYADDQERDPIVVPSSRLRTWASDLRAAIDQARGKGGGEVEGG